MRCRCFREQCVLRVVQSRRFVRRVWLLRVLPRARNISSVDNDSTIKRSQALVQCLPFTLHVQKDFEYAYANQGNFTIERQLTKDMTLSGSYIFVGAHHLPHPLDINAPRTDLQIQNFFRLAGRNPVSTTEAVAFSIPTSGAPCPGGVPLQCFTMSHADWRSGISERGPDVRDHRSGHDYGSANQPGQPNS